MEMMKPNWLCLKYGSLFCSEIIFVVSILRIRPDMFLSNNASQLPDDQINNKIARVVHFNQRAVYCVLYHKVQELVPLLR